MLSHQNPSTYYVVDLMKLIFQLEIIILCLAVRWGFHIQNNLENLVRLRFLGLFLKGIYVILKQNYA